MNPRKQRKSLDDIAAEFVYNEPEQSPSSTSPQPSNEQQSIPKAEPKRTSRTQKKSGVMEKLMQTSEREPTIRLTVDMPESMHRKLSILSAKTGRKKADIVRMLLDEALEEVNE